MRSKTATPRKWYGSMTSTTDDDEAKSRLTLPPRLTGTEEDAEQDRGTSRTAWLEGSAADECAAERT